MMVEGESLTLAGDKLPIGTLVGEGEQAFADSQGDARHAEEHASEEGEYDLFHGRDTQGEDRE
jgi:hypothetical protein